MERPSVWPRLLPAEYRGGINSESRKRAVMEKKLKRESSVMARGGMCLKKPLAMGSVPMPISDDIEEPEEVTEAPETEETPEVGRYTGTNGKEEVDALAETDMQVHEGEFVLNADTVALIGGEEAVEDLVLAAIGDKIKNAETNLNVDKKGRSIPIPISEDFEDEAGEEQKAFEKATGEEGMALGGAVSLAMQKAKDKVVNRNNGGASLSVLSSMNTATQNTNVDSRLDPISSSENNTTPDTSGTLDVGSGVNASLGNSTEEERNNLRNDTNLVNAMNNFDESSDIKPISGDPELMKDSAYAQAYNSFDPQGGYKSAHEAGLAAKKQKDDSAYRIAQQNNPVVNPIAPIVADPGTINIEIPKTEAEKEEAKKQTQASILKRQAMDRMASQAAGNNPYLERIVAETLQKNAGDTVAARAALQAELAQQGITGNSAAGIMNSFDAKASLNKAGLEGDLAKEIMKDAISTNKELAALATQQEQFEKNYDLSSQNYQNAENWKKLSFMLDSNTDIGEIQDYVANTFGLDVDLSNLKTAQQASQFAGAMSGLSTYVNTLVGGGDGLFDNLDNPGNLDAALADAQVKKQIDAAWISIDPKNASTIGSQAYKDFAKRTLTSMRNINDPVMPLVNSLTDDSIQDLVGDRLISDDFTFGGNAPGLDSIRAALRHIALRGGLSQAEDGTLIVNGNNEAWSIFGKADATKAAAEAGLTTASAPWATVTRGDTKYVNDPVTKSIREYQPTDAPEFRNIDGSALPAGTIKTVGDKTYKSAGNHSWTEVDTTQLEADFVAGDPFGSTAEVYLNEVGGGDYNSPAGKKVLEAQTSWIMDNQGIADSYTELSGLTKDNPLYNNVLSKAADTSTLSTNLNRTGSNTREFVGLSTTGAYYKVGNNLIYIKPQSPTKVETAWGDGYNYQKVVGIDVTTGKPVEINTQAGQINIIGVGQTQTTDRPSKNRNPIE